MCWPQADEVTYSLVAYRLPGEPLYQGPMRNRVASGRDLPRFALSYLLLRDLPGQITGVLKQFSSHLTLAGSFEGYRLRLSAYRF